MIGTLALALALAAGPRTDLTLVCGHCFGLEVDLDGEHLVHLPGVGGARVEQGKLGAQKDARFEALAPGTHHLKVELFTGPLNAKLAYDGPVFLRPGASMVLRVKPEGGLEEVGAPAPAPPTTSADGGAAPLRPARLVLRADDAGGCSLVIDGAPRANVDRAAVLQLDGLAPGIHDVELRSAQGARLLHGTLYLGSGEEAVGAVKCATPSLALDTDPYAFHALP